MGVFLSQIKNSGDFSPELQSSQLFCRQNLFLVVRMTSLAYSVRHHQCATIATLNKIWSRHLPVCSTAISSSLGMFILRTNSSHDSHLLLKIRLGILSPKTRIGVLYFLSPSLSTKIFTDCDFFSNYCTSAIVSRAMASSSFVGTTITFTLLSGVLMTISSPRVAFFSSSITTPR